MAVHMCASLFSSMPLPPSAGFELSNIELHIKGYQILDDVIQKLVEVTCGCFSGVSDSVPLCKLHGHQPTNHRLWICHGTNCSNGYISSQLIYFLSWVRAEQIHDSLISHAHHDGGHWLSGSSLNECCDIYKHVSLTAEARWDYWTFSGLYLMEVKLDFNDLTGVVCLDV